MQIDSTQLINAINNINKNMGELENSISTDRMIIEKRLDELQKAEDLLKAMVDALSNDPNDPYLESPQLEESEENLTTIREEIDNLEDILDTLNEFDLSSLIIYSTTRMQDNDDTLEAVLPSA